MSERSDRENRAFALLRTANPVEVEDIRGELDAEQLAAVRAQIFAALRVAPEPGPGRLARQTADSSARVRRVRLAGPAGGAAAAAALTVAGLVVLFQGGGEPASALRVLNAAASIAAREPATAPGPGEYTYVRQRFGVMGGATETVEWWVASDGSGRMRRSGPQVTGIWQSSDGHLRQLPATVVGRDRRARDVTFGPGRFAEFYAKVNPGPLDGRVEELSTDPEPLERVLRLKLQEAVDFNPDPAAQSLQLLQVLEQVLANPLASPELRSAVYEIAARLEGVEISENVTDPVGRAATAITLCSAAIPARYEVFFDPATSATLGTREVSPVACNDVRSYPSGLTSFSVYLEEATVDSIHQRP
jgi:hypothetical protein